jgi:hypothetical protein
MLPKVHPPVLGKLNLVQLPIVNLIDKFSYLKIREKVEFDHGFFSKILPGDRII